MVNHLFCIFFVCLFIVFFLNLISNCLFTKFGLIIEIHVFVRFLTLKDRFKCMTLTYFPIEMYISIWKKHHFYWTKWRWIIVENFEALFFFVFFLRLFYFFSVIIWMCLNWLLILKSIWDNRQKNWPDLFYNNFYNKCFYTILLQFFFGGIDFFRNIYNLFASMFCVQCSLNQFLWIQFLLIKLL